LISVPAPTDTSLAAFADSTFGAGFLSAGSLEYGAFDRVALQAGRYIEFIGDMTISGVNNLELHASSISGAARYSPSGDYSGNDRTVVNLSVAHLWIDGAGDASISTGDFLIKKSFLNLHATTIDLGGFGSGSPVETIVYDNSTTPPHSFV